MQAGRKPRVLVVDDEQVIADTLAKILDLNGYDASAVYTGTAAVESARSLKPDLVISDVIMPDMNGIEAAISIRGFLP
ncbi:MAG TPA: response regulator, partial [Verrucomicrobiae bacterium]|nr:response regulator [Verrucomicrobiae bacterium]